jgi:hypothetical protein
LCRTLFLKALVRRLLAETYPLKGAAMADDAKQTGKPDDQRINIEQEHELNYWSRELSVSREKLRAAVQNAGPMVKNVRQHLNR